MDSVAPQKFLASIACPHAAACPGCPMIALPYTEQLENKQLAVRVALDPYPELGQVTVAATEGAGQIVGYRTRAKLVAAGAAIGLFARGTHDVVDTPACQVLDPLVAALVGVLRSSLSVAAAGSLLEGVDVARVGERLLVTLIAGAATDEPALRELARTLQERVPAVAGVAFTRRGPGAVQLLSGGHTLLLGVGELSSAAQPFAASAAEGAPRPSARAAEGALPVSARAAEGALRPGPYHYLALGAFQQAHEETSAAIYERLVERLLSSTAGTARPRVLELYAGSGALSLALAARGAEVVAVESYAPACERLARAAREQGLSVQVHEGDAGRELRALWESNQRFDVVLVNPPRRGLDPEVREIIAQLSARAVGYVSCKPSTLARDLAHFARLGLRCVEATPFDMMPLTEQVETLSWLEPAPLAAAEVVFQDSALVVVNKGPHEVVDARGMRGLSERVRKLPGFQAALPVSSLASGSSGLVPFARAKTLHASVEQMLDLERVFTALVRGVVRERGKLRVAGRNVRYERLRVSAGHSLVRVVADDDAHVLRAFRAIGQPVIGDRSADRASAKHFMMRHGLDRTFLHESERLLTVAGEPVHLTSPLSADLLAVLASMGDPS